MPKKQQIVLFIMKTLKSRLFALLRTACLILIVLVFTIESGYCAEGYEDVANSPLSSGSVLKYGMTPIYPQDIKEGTYPIEGLSSSAYFRIKDATITVKEDHFEIDFSINSLSYKCIYMGTGEEAAAADISEYIFPDTADGITKFHIEVDALNKEYSCSAFSKNRKKWYERHILFDAASLPTYALTYEVPDYDVIENAIELYDEKYGTNTKEEHMTSRSSRAVSGTTEPVKVNIKDGTFSIEVGLTGGSGRASVSSPTWFIVKDRKAYAKLLWSSPNYDYMIVGGKKFMNETLDGSNSTFTIPITAMDKPITVIGDTTAMGDPLEIEYQLTFYEDTIANRRQVPQEAAMLVLKVAVVIMIIGGIINFFVKRRRKN